MKCTIFSAVDEISNREHSTKFAILLYNLSMKSVILLHDRSMKFTI